MPSEQERFTECRHCGWLCAPNNDATRKWYPLAAPTSQADAKKESGWLPIETAPRNGTNILLTNGVNVAQGWWEHQEPYIREHRDLEGRYIDQDESDGFDGWLDCDGGMLPEPTHWQPLPAPPAQSGSDQGDDAA